jgi:hypothetical protein
LANELRSKGVTIERRYIKDLEEAFESFGGSDIVVNATGLGKLGLSNQARALISHGSELTQ